MKTRLPNRLRAPRSRRSRAFTIAEMMVAMGVFMFMMGGVVYGYLNGMYLFQVTQLKLETTDDARKALIKFNDDIRSANRVWVGNGTLSTFTAVGGSGQQKGNAIMVYPDTNYNNNWEYYFYDTNVSSSNYTKLCRITNGIPPGGSVASSGALELVIAHSIVASPQIFAAEDPWTNIVTSNINNKVISMNLSFYQVEYPIVNIGTGAYYNSYQLHTRVTARVIY